MIVLKYIRNESRCFQTYVTNRVTEIRELTFPHQWRHYPDVINPADDASRGLRIEEFLRGSSSNYLVFKISKVCIGFAVKINTKLINVHNSPQHQKGNRLTSAEISISSSQQLVSNLITSIQVAGFTNVRNGIVKLFIIQNSESFC